MAEAKKELSEKKKNIGLVEQRLPFARKERRVQRVGLVLITLFLAAGLLGFFGGGIWSSKKITGSGYSIEYEQYLREDTPSKLSVYLDSPKDTAVVSFNSTYLTKMKISQVVPQPVSAKIDNERIIYTFNSVGKGVVIFYLTPDQVGKRELNLGVLDEMNHIKQFVHY